jgi:tRNA pseudouridine55 synthase
VRDAIDRALEPFRGTFLQQPPAFSAKKIEGLRSYKRARKQRRNAGPSDTLPAPVSVTAHGIEVVSVDESLVTLRVDCSAGFYVRSLAHDLGQTLGTGGHLVALRRTRTGDLTIDEALDLADAERRPSHARAAVVPLARMLPQMAAVVLTPDGVRRATQGRDVGPESHLPSERGQIPDVWRPSTPTHQFLRLLDPAGELVAIAEPTGTPGLLHPSVVLM